MTSTTMPRALYKLVDRVRRKEHKISGAHNNRGGVLMVEWQSMLLRDSRSRGFCNRLTPSGASVVGNIPRALDVPRVQETPPGRMQESHLLMLCMQRDGEPCSRAPEIAKTTVVPVAVSPTAPVGVLTLATVVAERTPCTQ